MSELVNEETKYIYILIKTQLDLKTNYCRNNYDYELSFISLSQLYLELKDIAKKEQGKIIITFCSDPSVSASIVPVINELKSNIIIQPNFKLGCEYPEYKSKLKIIKFTSESNYNYKNAFVQLFEPDNVIKHQIILNRNQFILIGPELNDSKFRCYSGDMIKVEKIDKILKFINSNIDSDPVFIDFDLSVLDQQLSPLCLRHPKELNNENPRVDINNQQLKLIMQSLSKLNICGMNISGYCVDFNDTSLVNRIQIETIQQLYGTILKIKEKKINIYNENSRFLIFKPKEELYDDIDQFGWYIMRNVDSQLRYELLQKINDGEIIEIEIQDDELKKYILISTTTLADQDDMSYYLAEDYSDKRLYPDEKIDAYFNLLI
jgi:hypothetical protein